MTTIDASPLRDDFGAIPAWRIEKLRAALRDVQFRARNLDDDGADIKHRALRRRFEATRRSMVMPPTKAQIIKPTRRGKSFPLQKMVIIWRAILKYRPADWKTGNRVNRGAISSARAQATAECKAAGFGKPQRYTFYVLWCRGEPSPEVMSALQSEPRVRPTAAGVR